MRVIYISLATLSFLYFNQCSCHRQEKESVPGFNSLEGLWISTPETAVIFGLNEQKTALRFQQDSTAGFQLDGNYLLNDDFYRPWALHDFNYNKNKQIISFTDIDGDSYLGEVNKGFNRISGEISLKEGGAESLHFIRSSQDMEGKLYFPVPDAGTVYAYRAPEQINDGLETGCLEEWQAPFLEELVSEIIDQRYGRLEAILIAHGNRLMVEEYFYGYHLEKMHRVQSCTKSIVSLTLGILMDRYKQLGTESRLDSLFPAYSNCFTSGKEAITVKDVLTMTSGLAWNFGPPLDDDGDDLVFNYFNLPLRSDPGTEFQYSDGNADILGALVKSLAGIHIDKFANEYLFRPMGISDFIWQCYPDGLPLCGSGLKLKPRDMVKIGLLVLHEGQWNGAQVVPKDWILESTNPVIRESEHFHYGYQWWLHGKQDQNWWETMDSRADEVAESILAIGWGGQYILVFPSFELVVVLTASNYHDDELAFDEIAMVYERILPLYANEKR